MKQQLYSKNLESTRKILAGIGGKRDGIRIVIVKLLKL